MPTLLEAMKARDEMPPPKPKQKKMKVINSKNRTLGGVLGFPGNPNPLYVETARIKPKKSKKRKSKKSKRKVKKQTKRRKR